MKQTIGIFAHVDAGKTTFCEALLYEAKAIKSLGRVDHQNTLLDHDALERKKGITIFSDLASFAYAGREFYLIDTPGHMDFSGEMERTMEVLDAAILVVSATDGVQSHTITAYQLLKEKNLPIFIFLNKCDRDTVNTEWCMQEIRNKLSQDVYEIEGQTEDVSAGFLEWLSEYDDKLLEDYLEEQVDKRYVKECVRKLVTAGQISLVKKGSALKQEGIGAMLALLSEALEVKRGNNGGFAGKAFKVTYDQKGNRVTFIKCLDGKLNVKDEITYHGISEKIHEIRAYEGGQYSVLTEAHSGDIIGVTGLTKAIAGTGLGACKDQVLPIMRPALRAAVQTGEHSHEAVMACLKKLNDCDPLLEVRYEPVLREIHVCVMGKIQLEVLQEMIRERYRLNVSFGECQVLYKETVKAPVIGYGHYEPLRHYAEVHVRIEPTEYETLTFKSECHSDQLPLRYQNLVGQVLLARPHRGILTGSPLSHVQFVLVAGAHHLKHTEGGDFKEAAYRAVRQGLEKAENIVLEPYYQFQIQAESVHLGRILSDIQKMHGEFEPVQADGDKIEIRGTGPVAEFLDYPAELLSFTKGKGAVSMRVKGYYPCHNQEAVIARSGYEKERDLEQVSSSVFCKKGAGFEVKWQDAEQYMHLLK